MKTCNACGKEQPVTAYELLNCAFCGRDLAMEDIFVMGGEYNTVNNGKIFLLVRPSHDDRPYLAKQKGVGTLFNLTKHHAHKYRVISEKELVLQETSWEAKYAGVDAPLTPVLDTIVSHHLQNALDRGEFIFNN